MLDLINLRVGLHYDPDICHDFCLDQLVIIEKISVSLCFRAMPARRGCYVVLELTPVTFHCHDPFQNW